MSSAGIIYKYYGKQIIDNISKHIFQSEIPTSEIDIIYEKIYRGLILEIDAVDNGEKQTEEKPRY